MTQPPPAGGANTRPGVESLPPGPASQFTQPTAVPAAVGSSSPGPEAPQGQGQSVPAGTAAAPGSEPAVEPAAPAGAAQHLLWSARKDSKPIVSLWLTPTKDGCDLGSDIYPVKSLRVEPVRTGPYRFQRAEDAQAFAQEAARALMHLGCEIVDNERHSASAASAAGSSLRITPAATS